MDTVSNEIEKIANHSRWKPQTKFDKLLEIDRDISSNSGTDSTEKEKKRADINRRKIYNEMKKLNDENCFLWGNFFSKTMDL